MLDSRYSTDSIDFLFIDTTTNQVVLRKTTDWRGDLSLPVSELYEGNFKLRIIAKTGSGEAISDNLKFIISNEKSRVVNKWVLDKTTQHWYHYDASGELSKNTWVGGYYLLADGKMATNQWVKDSNTGTWYYVNGTGARAKNTWVGSYYLLSDDKMAVNKWIKDSKTGLWYYVNSSGTKVKNTWIDGYYLSSDGSWVKNP